MGTTPDGDPSAEADGVTASDADGTTPLDSDADATASPEAVDPVVSRDRREAATRNRKRGVLSTLPFLAIGLADVVLLLQWGIEPLWGFAILPPILFCSVLAYLVFSTDFLEGRT